MLNFKKFLVEQENQKKYIPLDQAIALAPKQVRPVIENITAAIEPQSVVKVENKNIFAPYNGRKNSATIFKTSMANVKRLAKLFDETIIDVDKDHKGFYHVIEITDDLSYMIKVVKTGSLDFGARGSTKTVWQEAGVLVYLDNDLKPLDNYKPSPKIFVGADPKENATNIANTLAFLAEDHDWNTICLNTAKQIARKVPNYKQYELHRGDALFNAIKNRGLKLTGLTHVTSDKWNPSDVFLIKNGDLVMNKIKQLDNIVQYNQFIGEFDQVIGISLKKGDKDAAHGAISLDNVVAMKSLGQSLTSSTDLDENKKAIYNNLKKLHRSDIADLIEITKCSSNSINQSVEALNPTSENFNKSFPPAIEFLTRICDSEQYANDVITLAYLTAVSKHPLSCPHYKADGSKIVLINPEQRSDISLTKIIVPLNGDTNVIFVLDVDGKSIKLQLRSKGSKPQFIVLKTSVNTIGKPLSSISVD